jgi:DNA-binding MarR family transcriptional regulator
VSNTPDDIELGRLLTQLLRLVNPAVGDGPVRNGGAGNGAIADGRAAQGGSTGLGIAPAEAADDAAHGDAAAGDAAHSDAGTGDAGGGDAAHSDAGGGESLAEDGVPSLPSLRGIPQVSGSEARALIELVKARGIAQGELAGLLGLEKSTVSRLAAGLERKGWIRRGRDEGNQRYVRLYLTAEGGAVANRLFNAWHSRQERLLAGLTSEERAGLSAGLRGLVRGLAAEGLLGDAQPGSDHVGGR